TVLSQMDPKQQALVLGYAVPMPVVIRTRAFDQEFYRAVAPLSEQIATASPKVLKEKAKQAREELFGA
ncbi:MAG TPA: ATPase, partial [Candidatus Melainabacteria bacterium]|nr:ATPase [Candidatus Melainabacteria bacterium]